MSVKSSIISDTLHLRSIATKLILTKNFTLYLSFPTAQGV